MREWLLIYLSFVPFGVLYGMSNRTLDTEQSRTEMEKFFADNAIDPTKANSILLTCTASELPWPLGVRRKDNSILMVGGYDQLINNDVEVLEVEIKEKHNDQ